MFQGVTKNFNPTELILLLYLLITLPFVIIQNVVICNGINVLLQHLGYISIVLLASGCRIKIPNIADRFNWIYTFFPLLFLGFLYKETDYLNNLIFKQNIDYWFINLESSIFGFLPSNNFSIYISSSLFAESMYFGYFAYYLLIIVIPLVVYIKKGTVVARKTIFVIICSFLLYYLFFIFFPVSGPQFYFTDLPQLPQGYFFGDVIRFIQNLGEAPTAAFPSSHVAMCLILIYIAYKEIPKLWLWLLPIAILLIFSTVYIRAHYAIDVLAAFITAPLAYLTSIYVFKRLK